MAKESADQYSPTEIMRRMVDGLRRALTTPHKPNAALKAKKKTSRASRTRANAKKRTGSAAR